MLYQPGAVPAWREAFADAAPVRAVIPGAVSAGANGCWFSAAVVLRFRMPDEIPKSVSDELESLRAAVEALIVMNLQTVRAFYNILGSLTATDTDRRSNFINNARDVVQDLQKSTVSIGEAFIRNSNAG